MPCCDASGRSLHSISACQPVGSTLDPPTFSSTGDPRLSGSTRFPHPTSFPLVSYHATSATDLRAVLHPSTNYCCSGFLLPLSFALVFGHTVIVLVLRYSGSTSDAHRHSCAKVSSTCNIAQLHPPSVCAFECTISVSVGCPPDAISHHNIFSPPPSNSTSGCWRCGAQVCAI